MCMVWSRVFSLHLSSGCLHIIMWAILFRLLHSWHGTFHLDLLQYLHLHDFVHLIFLKLLCFRTCSLWGAMHQFSSRGVYSIHYLAILIRFKWTFNIVWILSILQGDITTSVKSVVDLHFSCESCVFYFIFPGYLFMFLSLLRSIIWFFEVDCIQICF